jgi:hypothetical protein
LNFLELRHITGTSVEQNNSTPEPVLAAIRIGPQHRTCTKHVKSSVLAYCDFTVLHHRVPNVRFLQLHKCLSRTVHFARKRASIFFHIRTTSNFPSCLPKKKNESELIICLYSLTLRHQAAVPLSVNNHSHYFRDGIIAGGAETSFAASILSMKFLLINMLDFILPVYDKELVTAAGQTTSYGNSTG